MRFHVLCFATAGPRVSNPAYTSDNSLDIAGGPRASPTKDLLNHIDLGGAVAH